MTTPKIATARLNIQQIESALEWTYPVTGQPMTQFNCNCREHLFVRRQLLKWRRHLRQLEREDRRRREYVDTGRYMSDELRNAIEAETDRIQRAFRLPPDLLS